MFSCSIWCSVSISPSLNLSPCYSIVQSLYLFFDILFYLSIFLSFCCSIALFAAYTCGHLICRAPTKWQIPVQQNTVEGTQLLMSETKHCNLKEVFLLILNVCRCIYLLYWICMITSLVAFWICISIVLSVTTHCCTQLLCYLEKKSGS